MHINFIAYGILKVIFPSFAYKIHQLEECRQFCLMHLKKMEWFNKLEQGDKSHKAMMAKNKYKVIYILSNI